MDDRTITVSISEDAQAFIDAEIASGRFATGSEVVRAALIAFEHAAVVRLPSGEPASLSHYLSDNAQQLKRVLETSEASGSSARAIPDIMEAVKSKLRANGSL